MGELHILDPGALLTVQDRGRPGFAHLGVPRSGAVDLPSHDLANRLVGNPDDAATLETTLTGCRFTVTTATRIAVTGALCQVRVDGRARAWGTALTVPASAEVVVGPADSGLRSHVAVAGGVLVGETLGSRSTDVLSGLGPAPLTTGSVIPLGTPPPAAPWVEVPPRAASTAPIEVLPGPQRDWFGE
ncbi:MAG: biotin-dependent carboxyltransferase, partial [Propionibacteriaceae bacterium]